MRLCSSEAPYKFSYLIKVVLMFQIAFFPIFNYHLQNIVLKNFIFMVCKCHFKQTWKIWKMILETHFKFTIPHKTQQLTFQLKITSLKMEKHLLINSKVDLLMDLPLKLSQRKLVRQFKLDFSKRLENQEILKNSIMIMKKSNFKIWVSNKNSI